mgnify:CR=1 FL=1
MHPLKSELRNFIQNLLAPLLRIQPSSQCVSKISISRSIILHTSKLRISDCILRKEENETTKRSLKVIQAVSIGRCRRAGASFLRCFGVNVRKRSVHAVINTVSVRATLKFRWQRKRRTTKTNTATATLRCCDCCDLRLQQRQQNDFGTGRCLLFGWFYAPRLHVRQHGELRAVRGCCTWNFVFVKNGSERDDECCSVIEDAHNTACMRGSEV